MKLIKITLVLSVVFGVVGCKMLKDSDSDKFTEYQIGATNAKPLQLPNDLNTGAIDDQYPVPKIGSRQPENSSVLPPNSPL